MGQIFISYSHTDRKYVHLLAGTLEAEGFNVWIDDRLDYGSEWPVEIQKRLDGCDAMVLVMSPRSLVSKWVQNEVNRALRKEKPLFPLLLEGTEPWLAVESTHIIDVTSGRLPEEKFYALLAQVTPRNKNKLDQPQLGTGQTGELDAGPVFPPGQFTTARSSTLHALDPAGREPRRASFLKKFWLQVILICLVCVGMTIAAVGFGVPWLMEKFSATASFTPLSATLPASLFVPNEASPTWTQMPATLTPEKLPGVRTATWTPVETRLTTPRVWDQWTLLRSFPSPGSGPSGVVLVGEDLWVIVPGSHRLFRLDLEGKIQAEFTIGTIGEIYGSGLAWDGASFWWPDWSRISRFDPLTGTELAQFESDMDIIKGLAWDGTGLWLVDKDGNLTQYDSAGQRLNRLSLPVDASGATALAWVEGGPWVVDLMGKVERFNANYDLLGTFSLSQCISGGPFYFPALFWDGQSLWMADAEANRIYQCAPGN